MALVPDVQPDSYGAKPVIVGFNSREIIVPLFRVGIPEIDLVATWERFRDFKTA